MATYYVRASMGNDGSTGLSPAQAWLTVDKAANEVAAADTVYIGSGLYRETVTMDTSGTSGNIISFIGDIDGIQTGDPGPVVISSHDALNGAAVRGLGLSMNNAEFITWRRVVFDGGTTAPAGSWVSATAFEEFTFEDCAFLAGDSEATRAMTLLIGVGDTPTTAGLVCRRCVFFGEVYANHSNNAAAHEDLKWLFENCLFIGRYGAIETYSQGIELGGSSSDTYSIGGVDIINCTFIAVDNGLLGSYLKDATNQCRLLNCVLLGCTYGAEETLCTNNAVYMAYTRLWACLGQKTGDVELGPSNDDSISGPIVGGVADLMWHDLLGWSPWKPWESMSFGDGTALTPMIGAASATYAPADDVYGNPRPMGRDNADDGGIVEARTRPQTDIGTVYNGTYSAKFAGAGFYEYRLPVAAAATTVTVWARYDGNYTGSLPILEALNITGDTDQSDVMVAAVNTWEQLSVTFTPTVAGFCTIRLRSQDTSADGECFFDLRETS